ncbi:MAG: ubiquinol-cytochrome C chaperone family protein [Dongiaceae bacterium]
MKRWFRRPAAEPARRLYEAVVAQSRQPVFFLEGEVPDTVDGRFEMVALHAHLLLRRLKEGGAETAELAQELFDLMFVDMDHSLREMGAGDLGVGRRVKQMATGFYGRIAAYDAGLAEGPASLASALRRNLFGTVASPSEAAVGGMAAYMRAVAARLAAQPVARLCQGAVDFGPAELPGPDPGLT